MSWLSLAWRVRSPRHCGQTKKRVASACMNQAASALDVLQLGAAAHARQVRAGEIAAVELDVVARRAGEARAGRVAQEEGDLGQGRAAEVGLAQVTLVPARVLDLGAGERR